MLKKLVILMLIFLMNINTLFASSSISIAGSRDLYDNSNTKLGSYKINGSYDLTNGTLQVSKVSDVQKKIIIRNITVVVRPTLGSYFLKKILGCGIINICFLTTNGKFLISYPTLYKPITYQTLVTKLGIYDAQTGASIGSISVSGTQYPGGYSGITAVNIINVNSNTILINLQNQHYREVRPGKTYRASGNNLSLISSNDLFSTDRGLISPLVRTLATTTLPTGDIYVQQYVKRWSMWGSPMTAEAMGPATLIDKFGTVYKNTVVKGNNTRNNRWSTKYAVAPVNFFFDSATMTKPRSVTPYNQNAPLL